MEKVHTAQVAKTLVLFFLLFMIPFISSSMRTSYLYFILNLLILVLAIESGILTEAPDSKDEKKHVAQSHVLSSPFQNNPKIGSTATTSTTKNNHAVSSSSNDDDEDNGFSILDKKPEKKPVALRVTAAQKKIKKSYSRPSLFFIGGFGDEEDAQEEKAVAVTTEVRKFEREVEEEGQISRDELFTRAETFIGNFYNQLKIQREESWKKIHGHYHTPL